MKIPEIRAPTVREGQTRHRFLTVAARSNFFMLNGAAEAAWATPMKSPLSRGA